MKLLLALLMLPSLAHATDWNSYHAADHFEWTDYNDSVHLLGAYAIAATGGEILKRAGMEPWAAALVAAIGAAGVGIAKETFFDSYAMKTDIKMWMAGGAAGGLTVLALEF